MSGTLLVVEDEEASQCQAQFSRLQAAFGLDRKITEDDVENYKYGDDLAALDANQPVGSMLNARMAILSMDIELCRNSDGAITSITMDVARFSTIGLARKSPKGFMTAIQDGSHIKHYRKGSNAAMSEEDLGLVRYHIQSMTYPCTTKNDDMAWGVHDNVGHKWCFRRHRNIFIFPDKHTAVRDLQSLGYDPLAVRDFCTRDICDIRELDKIFLARGDANRRGPYTGNQRTEILKSDQFSTPEQILKARECSPPDGKVGSRALGMLVASAKMAIDDATTAGWVRTREQIYGGLARPPPFIKTADDADMFLLEFDLARTKASCKRVLDLTLEHERARFRELPARMKVAFSANRAQCHRLTKSFATFPQFACVQYQTAQTCKLIQIASQEVRVRRRLPPSMKYEYQAPVAVALGATDTPNTTELQSGAHLPYDLGQAGRNYRKAGRNISIRLEKFLESQMGSWPEADRACIRSLYSIEEHAEDGISTKYPKMRSNSAFVSLAHIARELGWEMDGEMADWFIVATRERRKLRNWYDRLPHNDSRFEANSQHEAWLQTLIEVVVALAGHYV